MLRSNAAAIRTLLEAAAGAAAIVDRSGRLLTCNSAAADKCGLPHDQLAGRCLYDFFPPETAEAGRAAADFAFNTGKLAHFQGGRRDRVTEYTVCPIVDDDGRIMACVVCASDFGRHRQGERTAGGGQPDLQVFFGALDDIVFVVECGGRILHANPAARRRLRYSAEELRGMSLCDVYSPDGRGAIAAMVADVQAGGTCRCLVPLVAKDGTLVPAETTVVRGRWEGQNVLFGLSRDITEQRRREEALQKAKADAEAANTSKGDLLASVSHEIRTSLTAILGFAEELAERAQCCTRCPAHSGCKTKGRDRGAVETVRRNAGYLLKTVNGILDLSKIEAGKLEVESIPCPLRDLIADLQAVVRTQASAKRLSLSVERLGALPETIRTDPTRLRQILLNLLGNAVKFTETGGVRLAVRFLEGDAAGTGPALEFDVIDTGVGMTPAQAASLFQPFAQADASTARRFGGTGLGLSISRRLAELLRGEISLVSTKPGRGTCFRVRVPTGPVGGVKFVESPREADPGVESAAPPAPDESRETLAARRVLLAEDAPDNRRLIALILTKAGAELTVAENGQAAVESVRTATSRGLPFDIVLMDMEMPVMDGYEATALLRREGYNGPIVALTAHATEGDRQKCLDAGCDGYLVKPFNRADLLRAVRECSVGRKAADSRPARGRAARGVIPGI